MTNLLLMTLMLMMQPGPGVGERTNPDRFRGVTPVTDKFILPPKIPDCRNSGGGRPGVGRQESR